jgi:Matrixin
MSGVDGEIIGARYVPFRKLDLTYRIVGHYPSNTQLSNALVDSTIAAAFAKWQAASPFKFQPITSDTPDIPLSFGSVHNVNAAAETNWGTHAIVFDNSRTWVDSKISWLDTHPDLLSVAVHEIGHALGLPDNDDRESVMHRSLTIGLERFRGAIPQVDANSLKASQYYVPLFSEYYAKQGQTVWFKRERDGSIPSEFCWPPPGGVAWPWAAPVTKPASDTTYFRDADRLNFVQVSAGLDGTVWALDGYSYAYDFGRNDHGTHWTYRGRGLTRVAVFDFKLVLGIFPDLPLTSPWGNLKRYDYSTQQWISVHKGSLDSGYKFRHVAVGGTKGKGSVWAIASKRPDLESTNPHPNLEIVRYNGDIVLGNGDWEVVGSGWGPMLDLDVGRWSNGSLAVCGTPVSDWPTRFDLPMTRRFYEYVEANRAWWQASFKGIPPDDSTVDATLELDRYNKANGKCISVGDDGTIVAMVADRAFRWYDSGAAPSWTELGRPGMRWVDISVVNKERMWGIDQQHDIFSTIIDK